MSSGSAHRLKRALSQIVATPPRLIASPPNINHHHPHQGTSNTGPARRASVAIIIRLRPQHSPATSTAPSSPPSLNSPPLPDSSSSPTPPFESSSVDHPETTTTTTGSAPSVLTQLDQFFAQPWVNDPQTTIEILYIKRASRASDKWSGHVAFPGGRSEPDDESSEFTALRETWEEVGLDLAERDWISVGQLDDREITSSLGKRLLMILSPFVFLHTSPHAPVPELQETEVASAHWIPLELLHSPTARYGTVEIDIASRLAPKNKFARGALKLLVGQMAFKCILLPNEPVSLRSDMDMKNMMEGSREKLPDLRLWGLTLGMTLDLLSHMTLSRSATDLSTYPYAIAALDRPFDDIGKNPMEEGKNSEVLSPFASTSEASIFPRFSYPDINFLIYLFGWRYRRLLRHQPTSSSSSSTVPPSTPRTPSTTGIPTYRLNWAGMSLNAYYAAVRRALVVAVLLRAVTLVGTIGGLGWYAKEWWRKRGIARRSLQFSK